MATGCQYESDLDAIDKDESCLILMNHIGFPDMVITYRIFSPQAFNIVASGDGSIGLGILIGWLMRTIGCIPAQEFVTDLILREQCQALCTN